MEMEGVEPSGAAHPASTAQEQQHQQRQPDDPSPDVKQPPASPATGPAAPATDPARTAGPPEAQHTSNGVAPPVQQWEQPQPSPTATASPGAHSGTSHSASHPSTPSGLPLQPPRLPLPLAQIAGASLQATASAAVNAAAQHHAASTRTKEHLRWREPITVQYDAGGHPLAGRLSTQPLSPQLPSLHLPPVVPPTHQQQQQHQAPQQTQVGQPVAHPPPSQPQALAPLPVPAALQHQHQQPHQNHQNPAADPLNSQPQIPHAQPHYHNHNFNINHNQHHTPPPPSHHQFQHHQPPPASYPSKPALLPSSTSLPPLHQSLEAAQPSIFKSPRGHATPLQLVSKPPIMDPPRRASQPAQPPAAAGFPSPSQDYARLNSKFVDDCTRLTFAVQQSLPEAVRRIVRDNWQKCLLGSEFHQAFILNASIHHATSSITQRAVRDFGRKMVTESAEELIKHFTTVDLDSIADLLLEKASDRFLDKCLEKRLLTIEAKPLVNALARAERLGYDRTDIVLEDRHERVVVQEAFPGAPASVPAASTPTTTQPRPSQPQGPNSQLQCSRCFRTFPYQSAFDYHTQNNVCSLAPPTSRGYAHSCAPCGEGFVRIEDLELHTASKICSTKPSRAPARPVTQTPVANGYVPSQPQPTPTQSLPRRTASTTATGTPSGSPIPSDPYAHLTQEKLDAMNEELQEAEAKYAPRFQEAELISDEKERRAKIEGLRNSFGTKQSMIRKKYGVRLRERRTKAEILAERERLGIKRQEKELAKAFMGSSVMDPASSASKPPTAPKPSTGSGWTAANTPRADTIWQEHDAKRRRLDNTGGYNSPSNGADQTTPTRKLLSATELGGGLAGSSATAELHDPTLPAQQPATNGHAKKATAQPDQQAISVDDSSDSSDDEDIPSTLPSRSTPQRKGHLGTAVAS